MTGREKHMGTEDGKKDRGTSRQAEEGYLQKTLAVVRDNVENYGREVARMQENIDEMLAHYHDNDVEVLTILNNTVTLHEHMKRALERNEKAQKKPYFGRIVFRDEALDKEESIYIGRGGISKDTTHWIVVDWRAPVANAYYENSLGKCSYAAPGGVEMEIDLELKRTYEIEEGKLLDYFDSEVIANDDLLTRYLAKNKEAVLGEIVATIQKEQNEIIRKSPYHNIIVQGVAGSGKTTVAMHRISFILYNYAERFKPDDFYIVGSNRILLNYITGVLPDLDVYGVRQMTMEQLFVRLLYEDWDETKHRIKTADKTGTKESVKGQAKWFRDLEDYCRRLEWEVIPRESVFLNPRQFVEGFRNGKTGVFDETGGRTADRKELVRLVDREAVESYIRQNPSVSVQNKIDMLNERLSGKIEEEFLGKGIKYTEAERKAIIKAYRGYYGGRVWKRPIYVMYEDFLREQAAKGYETESPQGEFDVYDLAALAYLYKRVKEKEVISEAHHVVIDEAQDFGMMAYSVLKFCIKGCTYTVMGDVSQNIHFGCGLNDWEELKELLLPDSMDRFGILKKSYRNTVEISDFATNILHHGQFSVYPVEPILRHGNPVQVREIPDRKMLVEEAARICAGWRKKELGTIAVICRSREKTAAVSAELSQYVDVMESDLEKAVFGNGIMVLPVEYTKGLEFDAVLIFNPVREEYPADDGHAKLLYVAATRALHELCVLHDGSLTGLIADPAPERAADGTRSRSGAEPAGTVSAGTGDTESKMSADMKTGWEKNTVSGAGRDGKGNTAAGTGTEGGGNTAGAVGTIKRKRPAAVIRRTSVSAKTGTPEDKKPFISRTVPKPAVRSGAGQNGAGTAGGREKESTQETGDGITESRGTGSGRKAVAKVRNAGAGCRFGDMPATENLRPAGHGKIDLSVRWFTRQEDGLYLQSRYGTLRLSPITGSIVRVTFARDGQAGKGVCAGIAAGGTDKTWMYRESGRTVELLTDELCLQVDKAGGSVRYMTRDKKLLLAERGKECRQLETGSGGKTKGWLFLDWQKGENLFGCGAGKQNGMKLRGTARYISHGAGADRLPFVASDRGYGIVLATGEEAVCCDVASYGSYLYAEYEGGMDYYFIAGEGMKDVWDGYGRLCGESNFLNTL